MSLLEAATQRVLGAGGDAERVLMNTLAETSEPLAYLLSSYDRCQKEFDRGSTGDVEQHLVSLNTLIVSYVGLLLCIPGMFPQSEAQEKRGVLQLYDALVADKVPHRFFVDFASRFEAEEILAQVVVPVLKEIGKSVVNVSPLGDFQKPLSLASTLLSVKQIALTCVQSEDWLPLDKLTSGRSIEYESLLGPFFKVSTLPDIFGNGKPAIRSLLRAPTESDGRVNKELAIAVRTLRQSLKLVQSSLHSLILGLLKMGGEVREGVLLWVTKAIETNAKGRVKMRVDLLKSATHGFFLNLSSVMLHLCLPFMDPTKGYAKAWEKIDCEYIFPQSPGGRVHLAFVEDTRCAASLEEYNQWIEEEEKKKALAAADGGRGGITATNTGKEDKVAKGEVPQYPYHFICDCFFMTSKVMNMGFMKAVRDFLDNMKELSRHQHMLNRLQSSQAAWQRGPYRRQTEQQIEQLENWITEHKEVHLCYECAIQEDGILHQALLYYRLMGSWLLREAGVDDGKGEPQAMEVEGSHGEGAAVPPASPSTSLLDADQKTPDRFRMLPEFFVDDIAELLLFTARIAERQPQVLQNEDLDTFMSFLALFMGKPLHVHNPYLRAKMVDVLHHWVPPPNISHPRVTKMQNLFEFHEMGKQMLVRHLLQLYVDIEFTGSHTQFYDKFNIRHHIGELLEYLWGIPIHRSKWKVFANEQADGFYLKFVNMLVNDAIYLLDEGMKKLPEVRQTLQAMENVEVWNSQPPQEQSERENALRQSEDILRQDLLLANVHIDLMEYTTVEITKAFLLPEMVERIATMLNYFLRFLVGPERKQLKVPNPDKYGWDPKKMLSQIMKIYMHLAMADDMAGNVGGNFATSVVRDGRSYSQELFLEAQAISERYNLLNLEETEYFQNFIEKLQTQVTSDAKEDEMLGEIPDEFLDPIQYTLMSDPVVLPSSKVVLDRSTIQRHLLNDQTDPFNRSQLTADMLVPETDLKAKIEQWLSEQRRESKKVKH